MEPDGKRSGSPPRPEVQYLPTLFRRMGSGEIRIPAFQRALVWSNEQIRALFDSVYKGYPIGSLLLWQARADMFEPYIPDNVNLPTPMADGLAMYVLDGMQRLITLYAAFNGGGGPDNRFELVFGLEEQTFFHDVRGRRGNDHLYLKLSRVFSPRLFVQDQAELAKLDATDTLLNRAVDLHTRFQEYLVPIVTIEQASVDEAVKIFTNINRQGLSLSTVDFMRALTWHNNFDLNAAVKQIRDALPDSFAPGDETLAKCIALMLGIDPLPDAILKLQDVTVEKLENGVANAILALQGVTRFLKDRMGIASAEFVPYEGQLLVLVALHSRGQLTNEIEVHLVKWFIATSFSEMFQGRPDHAIVQMVKTAVESLRTGEIDLRIEMDVDADVLERKQLRKGTAVSAGLFTLFSLNNAKSVITGNVIDRSDYLEVFDRAKLTPIIREVGDDKSARNVRSRLINLILVSANESYNGVSTKTMLEQLVASSEAVLASQILDKTAIKLLKTRRYDEFLTHRTKLIREGVQRLVTEAELPVLVWQNDGKAKVPPRKE
jgi:hypothetical protein